MTPKEEAVELLAKMNNAPIDIIEWYKASDYAKNELKRKALIVVDEVISAIDVGYEDWKSLSKINFWQQVKTEIEKL